MAEITNSDNLFPKVRGKAISLGTALIDADISGLPEFNDKYAKLWSRVPFPKKTQRSTSVKNAGINKSWNSCVKPNPNRPSCTLMRMQTGRGFGTMARWDEPRALSIGEGKRIGSFPDQFELTGTYEERWSFIGNSVPPLFMQAIAGHLAWTIFGKDWPYMLKNTDYQNMLEEAWQLHLAPRKPDAPTVISTFAGCGGSSLGYSMAGFRELLAVEWNQKAVESFKLNFPEVPVYAGDICQLSVEECLKLAKIEIGELDILDGSPPCQGFSTSGKRNFDDNRNQLFREFVRLLRGLQPKVFVMENVSGLVKGKMRLIFAEIMRELKNSGYTVSCRLMNAMYFNVPQSRERLIFIGVRNDLNILPGHPQAESTAKTIDDALRGMEKLDGPYPKKGTKEEECCQGMKQGESASDFYKKNWGYNLFRLAWNRPAPVFTRGGGACGLIHPELPRMCIRQEYQAIMSYPNAFRFSGSDTHARFCMGNSVPPFFMRAIARYIRDIILKEINYANA